MKLYNLSGSQSYYQLGKIQIGRPWLEFVQIKERSRNPTTS